MGEANVVGSIITSSSLFDIGIDSRQYAIFQLRPELVGQDLNGNRFWYWLKAVGLYNSFLDMTGNGDSRTRNASAANGVRPRFLIG